jgi:hypothetical protein
MATEKYFLRKTLIEKAWKTEKYSSQQISIAPDL